MPDRPRLIAWVERGQEKVIADAIRAADLNLIGIGATATATAAAMSTALAVPRVGDLRQAVLRDDADMLWLAAPERIEADERRLIREMGRPVVSSEPRPVAVADLLMNPREARTAHFVPFFRHSPGYRGAMDLIEELGRPRCAAVEFNSAGGEGTLFARLFDAVDVLEALCGPAETIDAALAGAPGPSGAVPESLEHLHGHLTANIRFADDCCAALAISDAAGAWQRRLTLLARTGRLTITDTGSDFINGDGKRIESHPHEDPPSPGALIGMQITRLLEHRDTSATMLPPDTTRLLALCEAARLSCRTRQGEMPARLLEMLSSP
jgi:hypothetical protein